MSFLSGGGSPFIVTMLPLCGIGSVEGKGKGMSAGRVGTDVKGVSFVGTHNFLLLNIMPVLLEGAKQASAGRRSSHRHTHTDRSAHF